jgi:hypothetical protein
VFHFLFSASPFEPKMPEELFDAQRIELEQAGFTWSVCSDAQVAGEKPLRGVPSDSTVVYRGWMLKPDDYKRLVVAIRGAGARPLTVEDVYAATHYLPNWYPLIADLTPETIVIPIGADIESELGRLGWEAYFLKDYVKSLKTGPGSIVRTPREALNVIDEMQMYRGEIEGGLCVRRVEDFVLETERRYFVLNGISHGPDGKSVPQIVSQCSERIASPFFSIDVVRRSDGALRVVEIGDGQVSDLVGWSPEAFAAIWE